MKTLKKLFLLFFSMLALSSFATDYYVSSIRSGRSDSTAGTDPNAPWATMSRVVAHLNSLRPGDTVYLERGSVFEIDTSKGSDPGNYLKLQADGTAGNPVTITGSGYGTGNRPIIRRVAGSGAGAFVLIRAGYVTVSDIEFDGNMQAGFATSGIGFWADGTYDGENGVIHHVKILNNYMHNLGGTSSGATRYICGIVMNTADGYSVRDCLIEGNTISDYSAHGLNQYPGNHNNNIWRNNRVINSYPNRDYTVNSAIQAGTGTGNVYENNYLNDTTLTSAGGALRIAGKISDSGLNIIRNNVIAASGNHGIWFVESNSIGPWIMKYDVYGNIIYDCAKAGIIVQPGGDWGSGSFLNIYNNTLYRNWRNGGAVSDGELTIGRGSDNVAINIINNLIYHPDSGSSVCLALDSSHNAILTHNNNLYYRTGSSSEPAVNDEGNWYPLGNVPVFEPSAKNSDPLFANLTSPPLSVNYTDGAAPDGLSVQSASPAVGGGVDLGSSYAVDIDNIARTGAWTIGAYQTASAGTGSDDTVSPTVELTAPSNGSTLSGSAVTVSADASDNIDVLGVQFKLDGVNLGAEDTVAPYSVSWNTLNEENGSHTLTAVARDAAGNTATAGAITVTVENAAVAAPTVTITSPSEGDVVSGDSVTISAEASSSVGVAGVQFRLGTWNLGTEDTTVPYSVNWYTLGDTEKQYLTAVVRDTAGNTATSDVVIVTVDNEAPAVTLTAPADGETVSGTTAVSASVQDNVGVAGVQFLFNGAALGAEDTIEPYSVDWDTSGATNGVHSLTAVARDVGGNVQTAAVTTVTVDNAVLPDGTLVSSAGTWQNLTFDSQDKIFSAEFDAVAGEAAMDGVIGFSLGSAASYDDLAVTVRFNSSGMIDARNGNIYTADQSFSYSPGTVYHFRLVVDVQNHIFSAYVQSPTDPETLIAEDYVFREGQTGVRNLDTLAVTSEIGSHTVSNLTVEDLKIPAPPGQLRIRKK